jgi:hypothetical protein
METQSGHENIDSIVLEEEIDPNYVPSEAEVLEYAKWLGMDLEGDRDLFWIAREGLMAPLPNNWKPCKTKDTEDIYYFNFATGESTWDHPCDGYYKRLYEEEKKKKETSSRVIKLVLDVSNCIKFALRLTVILKDSRRKVILKKSLVRKIRNKRSPKSQK